MYCIYNSCISNTFLMSWYFYYIYDPRPTPEGIAEASQIVLRDAHVLPKLFSYE
jgi:hypothetical protein